ncbi:MAG: hypothetical protein PSX81_14495 [bacterium]|nr:hypothetical protein [bacterium]
MSETKFSAISGSTKSKTYTGMKMVFLFSMLFLFYGCKKNKPCDGTVQQGESVFIPITFIGFAPQEIDGIQVTRINNANLSQVDNFRLEKILWAYSSQSDKEHITDRAQSGTYDSYGSYFDNSTLIFKWDTGADTLSDFVVRKSKVNSTSECHKDDPNVSVDQVTYIHKGQIIPMGTSITVYK